MSSPAGWASPGSDRKSPGRAEIDAVSLTVGTPGAPSPVAELPTLAVSFGTVVTCAAGIVTMVFGKTETGALAERAP